MTNNERFIDNGDGTVTDTRSNLMWRKKDSLQDTKKWVNWLKGQDYVEIANLERFAGYDNWRYPNGDEAWTLFDLEHKNTDKYGDDIYFPSVFEPGSSGCIWTVDEKDSSALVIQYEDGQRVWPSKYSHMNMAVRMVRTSA